MNIPSDEIDPPLVACFRHQNGEPLSDPFVGMTARRIRQERRRRAYLRHALHAAAVAILVLGSRWLIDASIILSKKLDAWFAVGFGWLITPLGTAAVLAGVIGLALVAFRRRSHWRW